ncbi:methionyl-tRNA formyltransferase [Lichenihabitans sp. Uapishka_5]|uniref:methionyl-tRNA formyltransferase n=1 Tax=Lichenihabitans sp. Uapishka_5 TaxID=3037302 RepID=UPI0029E7E5A9|nr:methionyl-tRNA formyltransferase [Lichenihabitans sp. Uapishka_5]MDX7950944.1 methionyl-tRNA formyltransferase [Lichenihabitans sp. Uapishka_5]
MRLVFMGTPDFAVPTLVELVAQGHDIAAVYTRAPAPGGRGMALRPSPVQAMADKLGLPVEVPRSLKGDDEAERFRQYGPEAAVVVAFGLLLPESILSVPPLGCLNLHGSLLPRWRGAAPMQRAIMAGDAETGVEVMQMERGLDTGSVAMTERIAITPNMTAGDLHDRLAPLGADLMGRAVAALARGTLVFTAQSADGVTYAAKIDKTEARVDWSGANKSVHDHIRGLTPFPGAFCDVDLGRGTERLRLSDTQPTAGDGVAGTVLQAGPEALLVACGDGALAVRRLQRAGKPAMGVAEFLRGTPIMPGLRLAAEA